MVDRWVGVGGWFRGLVGGYHFGDVKVVERFFFVVKMVVFTGRGRTLLNVELILVA